MRDIKELLKILLDHIHMIVPVKKGVLLKNDETYGLCGLTSMLKYKNLINRNEEVSLGRYIRRHRPYIEHEDEDTTYYWARGDREAREKWLKEQISSL